MNAVYFLRTHAVGVITAIARLLWKVTALPPHNPALHNLIHIFNISHHNSIVEDYKIKFHHVIIKSWYRGHYTVPASLHLSAVPQCSPIMGLSQSRNWFTHRTVHVRYVVNKVTL